MTRNILSLCLFSFIFSFYNKVLPQDLIKDGSTSTSSASLEINMGIEIYRTVFVGGVGYNLYLSRNFIFLPAIDIIGVPIISGSLKYNIALGKRMRAYPKFGVGILPVGFLINTAGIGGLGIKYSFSQKLIIFAEIKKIFIGGDVISVGPPSFSNKNIKEYPPIVITIGIEF